MSKYIHVCFLFHLLSVLGHMTYQLRCALSVPVAHCGRCMKMDIQHFISIYGTSQEKHHKYIQFDGKKASGDD